MVSFIVESLLPDAQHFCFYHEQRNSVRSILQVDFTSFPRSNTRCKYPVGIGLYGQRGTYDTTCCQSVTTLFCRRVFFQVGVVIGSGF